MNISNRAPLNDGGWLPRAALSVALVVMATHGGCGKSGNLDADGNPPPGYMELISVTPIADAPADSLIPENAFESWWAGAPSPSSEAIVLPQGASELSREIADTSDGSVAIRQTWTQRESAYSPERLFGIEISDLEPRHHYSLTGTAKTIGDSTAILSVYGVPEDGAPLWAMAQDLVKISTADGWQRFEASFATGDITTVRIVTGTHQVPEPEVPCSVIWDDWKLTETGPAAWTEPKPAPDNLIANGSFEVWVPGETTPLGPFVAPNANLGHSTIAPMLLAHPDGIAALRQDWTASDWDDRPNTLFGIQVFLEPDTAYEFSMFAHMLKTGSVTIQAYGIDEKQAFILLADPLIEVPAGGEWQQLSGRFETGADRKVRIVVRGPGEGGEFPNKALFDAWTLTAVTD